jgi:hypothetical protein
MTQAEKITEYQNVIQHFTLDHIEWDHLPDYMQNSRQIYEDLSPVCKLYELFQSYIQREGFSDTDSWQSEWKAES